jgi:hypothetical protein
MTETANFARQHRPGYVCISTAPETLIFSTTDELRAAPWVKRWVDAPDFHQLSQSGHGRETLLIAETKGGKEWWVVGYLQSRVDGLPEWSAPT